MLIMLKLSTHSFFLDDEIGINCVSRGNSIHEHGEKAESSINITVLYTGQVLASLVGRSLLIAVSILKMYCNSSSDSDRLNHIVQQGG